MVLQEARKLVWKQKQEGSFREKTRGSENLVKGMRRKWHMTDARGFEG